jgi:MFS family permease
MVTASALLSAMGMLPVGWATDRWNRTQLLVISICIWGVAEGVSALAISFLMLLFVRLALGALTATTGPTVASLTGDLFPGGERSRIYGFILTGELIGAGIGLLVAGSVAGITNWRVAFFALAIPSFALAWVIKTYLPEPARGGSSRLVPGAERLLSAKEAKNAAPDEESSQRAQLTGQDPTVFKEIEQQGIGPESTAILEQDPLELSWPDAFRYVLRVRSNSMLIVASALGYFFFSGLETFALLYLEGHYRINEGEATLLVALVGGAAALGTILGGRLSDSLVRRGRIDGRLIVPAVSYVFAALALCPALISSAVAVSIPLFLVAGFALAAPNPGLDAARLDVMPSRIWGRAEGVRSVFRSVLQAFAPLLIGLMSEAFGGHSQGLASGLQKASQSVTGAQAAGLEPTFLLMLIPLMAAGVIVWLGRKFYPADVAAAAVTERKFSPQ